MIRAIAFFLFSALTTSSCAAADPLPRPPLTETAPRIEDLPSSIRVRQFMAAIAAGHFEDAEQLLSDDVTLTMLDGGEKQGRRAAIDWFRQDFAGHICGFWLRGDAGHLNDNSIYYGLEDGRSIVEYRPFGCVKPFETSKGGQRKRIVLRFTTVTAGAIERLELIP